jgi:hypothetical protein
MNTTVWVIRFKFAHFHLISWGYVLVSSSQSTLDSQNIPVDPKGCRSHEFILSSVRAPCPVHHTVLYSIILITFDGYKLVSSSLCNYLQLSVPSSFFGSNFKHFLPKYTKTAVAQWLRCCATNPKVVGSIPAGVVGNFVDIKSFRSHYGPGVDSASNRNEYQEHFLGVKAAGT